MRAVNKSAGFISFDVHLLFLFNSSLNVRRGSLKKQLFFHWSGCVGCFILGDIERMAYGIR